MSENLKNIDIIYRKELRNYSQSPPDDVWSNIEMELDQSKKNSFRIFYKVAAAIISLTLIGSVYLYLNRTTDLEKLQFADNKTITEEVSVPHNKDVIAIADESVQIVQADNIEINTNSEILRVDNKQENTSVKNEGLAKTEKVNVRDYSNLASIESYQVLLPVKKTEGEIIDTRKETIKKLINSFPEVNTELAFVNPPDQKLEKDEKWAFGGEFSPLYSYRHISETANKEFYNEVENPVVSYSGGLNFQYKALKRLTVQLGVYYSTMGQALDYMAVYENSAFSLVPDEYKDRYINSYALENSTGGITVNSEFVFVDERAERVSNLTNSKSKIDVSNPVFDNLNAELEQSFQYIEVPFLLRYKLIDKLIDINFVGGFGANFLIGNNVFIAYGDNDKEIIGHTEGVRDVNYNGTIGLGFEYPLMKRLNIRFEPSLKYYLNEINPTSQVESHPYSLGFYTGINYSF